MRVLRENCVVIDTSIIPKRPEISAIQNLLDKELKLDMALITSIQPHNIKNVVYLGMRDQQAAVDVASAHHLKHSLECNGKRYSLPIYVGSSAVDVRIHDLPPDMDNGAIVEHMRQYGEVISIQNEVWKSYFPGLINGVRVLRMMLDRPVPSYITVSDEPTLVTYRGQVKTCKHCNRKSHPKLKCQDAGAAAAATAAAEKETATTSTAEKPHDTPSQQHKHSSSAKTTTTNNKKQNPSNNDQHVVGDADNEWPSLTKPGAHTHTNKKAAKRQKSVDSDSTGTDTKKVNIATTTSTATEGDQWSKLIPVDYECAAGYMPGVWMYRGIEVGPFMAVDCPDKEAQLKLIQKDMNRIDYLRDKYANQNV